MVDPEIVPMSVSQLSVSQLTVSQLTVSQLTRMFRKNKVNRQHIHIYVYIERKELAEMARTAAQIGHGADRMCTLGLPGRPWFL